MSDAEPGEEEPSGERDAGEPGVAEEVEHAEEGLDDPAEEP